MGKRVEVVVGGRLVSPELVRLLEHAKIIEPVTDMTRARALARARASAAAAVLPMRPEPVGRAPARLRLPLGVAFAFLLGASGALATLLKWGPRVFGRPGVATAGLVRTASPSGDSIQNQTTPQNRDVTPTQDTAPPHRKRSATLQASHRRELALIERAQASYANGEVPVALDLLAAHERQFRNGWLAEEREALRVRALIACGREAEARRTLRALADRHPRSPILRPLRQLMAEAEADR